MSCPYLGLKNDPQTHMTFPSVRNCCQHSQPVVEVRPEHQSLFCLNPNFINCPVYGGKEHTPLPSELRAEPLLNSSASARKLVLVLSGGLLLILLLSLFLWQSGLLDSQAGIDATQPVSLPQLSPATDATPLLDGVPASHTPFPEPSPSPLQTAIPLPVATETPSPSPSVTPLFEAKPGTPTSEPDGTAEWPSSTPQVCRPPFGWMLYTVKVDDTLYQISLLFNTTVVQLQEANCMGSSTLIVAGQKLYVPSVPSATPIASPSRTPTLSPETPSEPSTTATAIHTSPTPTLNTATAAPPSSTYTPTPVPHTPMPASQTAEVFPTPPELSITETPP